MSAWKILNDVSIEYAIKEGIICLSDPDLFLENKADLIQPASLDVFLEGVEGHEPHIPIIGEKVAFYSMAACAPHPDVDNSFVTFWPGYVTDVFIRDLRSWEYEVLGVFTELRSSMRRPGLTVAHSGVPMMPESNGGRFTIQVANNRQYPISVEKNTKFANLIWVDREFVNKGKLAYEPHQYTFQQGIEVKNLELTALIQAGHLTLPQTAFVENNLVYFRAEKNATRYNNPTHAIIYKDKKVVGLEQETQTSSTHIIEPNEFVDIEVGTITLSDRVAMHVSYWPVGNEYSEEQAISDDYEERFLTFCNTGGWIDNGYDGIFSVQRQAFKKPLTIKEGQIVASARVFYFPQGVDTIYGDSSKTSNYQGAKRFTVGNT